jgi:hypothetical protein
LTEFKRIIFASEAHRKQDPSHHFDIKKAKIWWWLPNIPE